MPSPRPVTALPPHYREAAFLSIKQPRTWLPLVGLSLLAVVIGGVLVFGGLIAYHGWLDAPFVLDITLEPLSQGVGVGMLLGVLVLHEWIHGRWIARYGHRPRYGIRWYAFYATTDGGYFRRDEFVRIALAPLVFISGAGAIISLFVPLELAQWIALAVVVNASGAAGDILMVIIARRYGPAALIRDEADAIRIFVAD